MGEKPRAKVLHVWEGRSSLYLKLIFMIRAQVLLFLFYLVRVACNFCFSSSDTGRLDLGFRGSSLIQSLHCLSLASNSLHHPDKHVMLVSYTCFEFSETQVVFKDCQVGWRYKPTATIFCIQTNVDRGKKNFLLKARQGVFRNGY